MSDEDIDKLIEEAVEEVSGWSKRKMAAQLTASNPEWRERNAQRVRRLFNDPDWRNRHHQAMLRMHANPDWKRNNYDAMKDWKSNPDWKRNHEDAMAKMHSDPEYRMRHDNAMKKVHSDPEWHRKNKEASTKRSTNHEWRRNVAEAGIKKSRPVVRIEDEIIFMGGISAGSRHIASVLSGQRQTAIGYHWRYATPEEVAWFWAERERTGTDGPFKLKGDDHGQAPV